MDNAGENKLLEQRSGSADWKLGLKYEFTARDTPQQNHLAELGFSVIANRGRAMFSKANVPRELRYGLVGYCFNNATQLDGLVIITINGVAKTRYEHFGETIP